MIKKMPTSAGDATDTGSIPQLRRFLGLGNGNLLQLHEHGDGEVHIPPSPRIYPMRDDQEKSFSVIQSVTYACHRVILEIQ